MNRLLCSGVVLTGTLALSGCASAVYEPYEPMKISATTDDKELIDSIAFKSAEAAAESADAIVEASRVSSDSGKLKEILNGLGDDKQYSIIKMKTQKTLFGNLKTEENFWLLQTDENNIVPKSAGYFLWAEPKPLNTPARYKGLSVYSMMPGTQAMTDKSDDSVSLPSSWKQKEIKKDELTQIAEKSGGAQKEKIRKEKDGKQTTPEPFRTE